MQELFRLKKAPPDSTNPPGWSVVLAVVTKLGVALLLSQKILASAIGVATVVMRASPDGQPSDAAPG